ncbi:hypothetical protein TorRG33x02_333650 [Trema orientale]|uniref:Uncharacterized protein n=1 Tax=Trema orientale TaxID=63057 RepID=A0A2P5B3Y7_TREOI|nr:hypothetical protein TorRG33x02_333650 [Trema orientale]
MSKSWMTLRKRVSPQFRRDAMAFAERAVAYVNSEGELFEVANVRGGDDVEDNGDEMRDVLVDIAGSVEMSHQTMDEGCSDVPIDGSE